jgi:hypothetical protein
LAEFRELIRQILAREDRIEVDCEFKFLPIFSIRHKSSIRSTSAHTRFLVLLIPALMLVLALCGAIALVWLLGPKFHL